MKKIIFGALLIFGGLIIMIGCKGKAAEHDIQAKDYTILQKWDLPEVLKEISGIAWIGNNRVACVQDEDGILFIYNLKTSAIEHQIKFGRGGDYEGVAVVEKDAYVLRSDGIIIEIPDFLENGSSAKSHKTNLDQLPGINIEGLCADPANNRLLLAEKEQKNSVNQKKIYAVDLDQKISSKKPIFEIDFSHPIFQDIKEEEKFMPGELCLHPITGEVYILDGSRPKLLITDSNGNLKELIMLQPKDFGNPEGLTFNDQGELFISNEAENGPANILKVSLNR